MKRSYKIATIIVSVMLVIVAVSTMGVSYAIWTSADGIIEGGAQSQSPSVTPELENYVWAKYCDYEIIDGTQNNNHADVVLTGINSKDGGINLSDVYIPNEIWVNNQTKERINTIAERTALGEGNYTTYSVKRISNQFFSDRTLQELPIRIYIPYNVEYIDMMAFANLPNLEYVYCLNRKELRIDEYAFLGCTKLKAVYRAGIGNITAETTAFTGTQIVAIEDIKKSNNENA